MLSKILGRWLSKASTNDDQAKVNNLPKHEQTKLMVEKVANRKPGRPFNPIKAAVIELQCIDSNIISLITRIDSYAAKLELSEGLTPQDCFSEIKNITLDQFFTDSDDMYISLEMVDSFVLACQRLFKAIDRGLANKSRDVEYSIRLMGKCFTSVQHVCTAIEEAAH
jgi:hypothetical protein